MNFNEKVDNVCRLLCMQDVDCTYNLLSSYNFLVSFLINLCTDMMLHLSWNKQVAEFLIII